MELSPTTYYNLQKYSDTFNLLRMAVIDYFGKNLFKEDFSRIIYASSPYAFRQRLNLLSKNGESSVKELDLPFMRFYRQTNWQIDYSKPAVLNATAALSGFTDESIGNQNIRFLQAAMKFDCTLFFTRDDDAQMAYETLLWIQQPAMKQIVYGSLEYKGYTIEQPYQLQMENPVWMPAYNETEWLQKSHIIPIDFTLNLRSFVLSQSPQTSGSTLFWDDSAPVITEKVIVDFLSYYSKTSSNYTSLNLTPSDKWMTVPPYLHSELVAILDPDIELGGVISISDIATTSFEVNWEYSGIQTYIITVSPVADTVKTITDFKFANPSTVGTINESAHTIAITVPYGTTVTSLTPAISILGASISPSSGVSQDFTSPVSYAVTAADDSVQEYVVTVAMGNATAKAITKFNLSTPNAIGVINESAHTITITVPYATVVTALTPSINITGVNISPSSGTACNFTSPVVYSVVDHGGNIQTYIATVVKSTSLAKEITSFNFNNPPATGIINEATHTINISVPHGTSLTALTPSIGILGSKVSPLSGLVHDFTNPVTYTVTSNDGLTVETDYKDQLVVITINQFTMYNANLSDLKFLVENLTPGSDYEITVTFFSASGKVTKYTTTARTVEDSALTVTIRGIVGYH